MFSKGSKAPLFVFIIYYNIISKELNTTEKHLESIGNWKGNQSAAQGATFDISIERILFAMVAGMILAPGSKLSLKSWVSKKAYINGLAKVDVHSLYRAMYLLMESNEEIQKQVFTEAAKHAGLDLNLIFLDTTNTYFETDEDTSDYDMNTRSQPWYRLSLR